jgi:hypothetical protein
MPPGGCESSSFCASSLFSCGNAPTETTIHYREPPPQIGRSFFFKAWSWPPFFLFIIVSFGGRSGNSSISRHQSTNEADGIRGFSSFRSSFPPDYSKKGRLVFKTFQNIKIHTGLPCSGSDRGIPIHQDGSKGLGKD